MPTTTRTFGFLIFCLSRPQSLSVCLSVCLSANVKSYKHGSEEGGAVALKDWLLPVPLLLAVEPRAL